MSLRYTVREVAVNSVTIDFENGAWATVPIDASMSKGDIEARIRQFAFVPAHFSSAADVPLVAGDEGELVAEAELSAARKYTYAEIRAKHYPSLGDQLDAAYWARSGRTEGQEAIDAAIAQVKRAIPKDVAPMTLAEAGELTAALAPAINDMTPAELIEALES
jgi:hypothetical protein